MGEINSSAENADEPLIKFSYDNSLEEIDGAMKSFQQKFKSKRDILLIISYSVIFIAIVVSIFMNPSSVFAYVAALFCCLGLAYTVTDKSRARKKTIEALKDMSPEDYSAAFFEGKIEIETIIKPKKNEVSVKLDEEADEEIISPLKTTFVIGQDLLEFIENDESLLLVFNRQQIYCFPKRCLTVEQESEVRDYLTNKIS